MKSRKFCIACVAVVLALSLCFAVACNHAHQYTKWGYNATEHWKECPDDGEIDETSRSAHNFGVDGKCTCGAEKAPGGGQGGGTGGGSSNPVDPSLEHAGHDVEWRYDAMQHWKFCKTDNVADMTTYSAHDFSNGNCVCGAEPHTQHEYTRWRYNGEGHWKACAVCGLDEEPKAVTPHQFVNKVCECGAREKGDFEDGDIGGGGGTSKYAVIGSSDDLGGWTVLSKNRMYEDETSHYIELTLKAGDQFKVREWDDNLWERQSYGFGKQQTDIEKDSSVMIADDDFFAAGYDDEGNENDNFLVLHDCQIYINIYFDNPNYIKFYIESADPDTSVPSKPKADGYFLVGSIRGVLSWGDTTGNAVKMNYHEDTQTYTVDVEFNAGDKFQIKPAGKSWDGQVGGESLGKVTFAEGVTQPDGSLFTGTGDIEVMHACTVTITLTADKKIDVLVKSITINTAFYTYTFWLYAPNWSDIVIHIWDGAITTGKWASTHMSKANDDWWYYSYVSATSRIGNIDVIMANKGIDSQNDRVTLEASGDSGKIPIKENMYFKAATNAVYDTWQETGAQTAPVMPAAGSPVQVAAVPTQSYRKYGLAA